MFRHTIKLKGQALARAGISSLVLRDLLQLLTEGSVRAIRLRVEGRSTASAPPPSWFEQAAEFEVSLKEPLVAELKAPPIYTALPEDLRQEMALLGLEAAKSCLAIFTESLAEALAGETNSDLYDAGLLQTFGDFARLFARGIESVEITSGLPGQRAPLMIQPAGLEVITRLRGQIPSSSRMQVSGKVDSVRRGGRTFKLILNPGAVLMCVAHGACAERLASLRAGVVVVSGEAVFRPSGFISRLEVDHIEAVQEEAAISSPGPPLPEAGIVTRALLKQLGPRKGIEDIFGS